jgi:lipoic acid synthetase
MAVARRHPEWIKVRAPGGEGYASTKRVVQSLDLHTVCEEAHCPNLAECWGHRTATFMLLGDVCTRNCGYCAVAHGRPVAVDPHEPERVAEGVERLGLRHVVVTSVDRDDLADGGASHFAATARAIKRRLPECTVEVLTPDFKGDLDALATVVDAPIDVFNHNTETVPRLYKLARPGGRYERCLSILAAAKARRPSLLTKTGLMLGLGEETTEVQAVLGDLREVGCDNPHVGAVSPADQAASADRALPHPGGVRRARTAARALGFRHVESGPLVRSSYHAWQHVE